MLFRNKKGFLRENIVFLILNILFFAMLVVGVGVQGSTNGVLEDIYAKKIVLAIDSGIPGDHFILDINALIEAKDANLFNGNIVEHKENRITVRVSADTGKSYSYFSNEIVRVEKEIVVGANKLHIWILGHGDPNVPAPVPITPPTPTPPTPTPPSPTPTPTPTPIGTDICYTDTLWDFGLNDDRRTRWKHIEPLTSDDDVLDSCRVILLACSGSGFLDIEQMRQIVQNGGVLFATDMEADIIEGFDSSLFNDRKFPYSSGEHSVDIVDSDLRLQVGNTMNILFRSVSLGPFENIESGVDVLVKSKAGDVLLFRYNYGAGQVYYSTPHLKDQDTNFQNAIIKMVTGE
ncbi:MAG: hypothetical protein KKF56_03975 [Nanoarchaeota archaeon]|nr:hypothetical protein [Nanoarchaeota archaeon]